MFTDSIYNYVPDELIRSDENVKDNGEGVEINWDMVSKIPDEKKEKDSFSPGTGTTDNKERNEFESGTKKKAKKPKALKIDYLKINTEQKHKVSFFGEEKIQDPPLYPMEILKHTKYGRPYKIVEKYIPENNKMKVPQFKRSEIEKLGAFADGYEGKPPRNKVDQLLDIKVIFKGELV